LTEALSPTLDTRNRYVPPPFPTNVAAPDGAPLMSRASGGGSAAPPVAASSAFLRSTWGEAAAYQSPTRSVKSPAGGGYGTGMAGRW